MSLEKIVRITGRAVAVPGDDIDTDRIIPARFLKCITFDELGKFAFYDERKNADGTDKPHALNDPAHTGASILVTGFNFGCGSSREHAPQSLKRAGFKAIIAGSFAEIFLGNATAIGMPCLAVAAPDLSKITALVQANPISELVADIAASSVAVNGVTFPALLPEPIREALTSGRWDAIADLLEGASAVETLEASLPRIIDRTRQQSPKRDCVKP
ncbi:MAG: 3-isopropylmalate dehydratase small subunit [Puniceicoccales bacterium]|jgi:3-isopropylmalate/(R)-2-methylmalate dehydratase small subunit|nr:3-isopropylmalate dehydratase small subunit [Puniceicoccales bacterium]